MLLSALIGDDDDDDQDTNRSSKLRRGVRKRKMRKFFDEDSPNALRDQVIHVKNLSLWTLLILTMALFLRNLLRLVLELPFFLTLNVAYRPEKNHPLPCLGTIKTVHNVKW